MLKRAVLLTWLVCLTSILSAQAQKCGTPYLKLQREKFKKYLAVPSNLDRTTETPHFRIYYTTTGTDAVANPTTDANSNGVPDYVDDVAESLEFSYTFETDPNFLGFRPPPLTQNDKVLIYLAEMPFFGVTGFDGQDVLIGIHHTMAFAPPNHDPEGTVKGALRVTAAHELFHAIKAAYDWNDDLWYDEATSTWIEEEVYPQVDDYIQYLSDWFAHPELSLDYKSEDPQDAHKYGSAIFFRYLSEKHGSPLVKRIVELTETPQGPNSLSAITQAVTEQNLLFNDLFFQFAVANLMQDYLDGSLYPGVNVIQTVSSYPTGVLSFLQPHLSSRYLYLGNIASLDLLRLRYFTQPDGFVVQVIAQSTTGAISLFPFTLTSNREGSLTLQPTASSIAQAILIWVNSRDLGEASGIQVAGDLSDQAFPFPPVLSIQNVSGQAVLSWQLSGGDRVHIYRSLSSKENFSLIRDEPATTTSITDTPGEGTFYYVLTAWDTATGLESFFSNEGMVNLVPTESSASLFSPPVVNFPNPFPRGNPTFFRFTLNRQADVYVEIYSPQGRTIYRGAPQSFSPGDQRTLSWNSLSDTGAVLGAGLYLFRLVATDSQGVRDTYLGRLVIR